MASNKMRNYITYAMALFQDKGHRSVILKAMGRAINKAVSIGERQGRWWLRRGKEGRRGGGGRDTDCEGPCPPTSSGFSG